MSTKTIMIEEVSEDLFMINDNSTLIKMLDFGYKLHLMLIESELVNLNEWEEFVFSLNLKISERTENFIFINKNDFKNVLNWLDWICRIIITSDGFHNYTNFIKNFLNESDKLFKYYNNKNFKEKSVTIEKLS